MTEQEKQAVETLTRSFTKMETIYKVKCTEVEAMKEEISRLKSENAALRERLEKAVEIPFIVIDKKTSKEADEYEIALHEDWAKDLMYCDMEGFAIEQDGTLILLDECGKFAYCPSDRFEVVSEARLAELNGGKG